MSIKGHPWRSTTLEFDLPVRCGFQGGGQQYNTVTMPLFAMSLFFVCADNITAVYVAHYVCLLVHDCMFLL